MSGKSNNEQEPERLDPARLEAEGQVIIAWSLHWSEAQAQRAFLETRGIPCRLAADRHHHEFAEAMIGGGGHPIALVVDANDETRALRQLDQLRTMLRGQRHVGPLLVGTGVSLLLVTIGLVLALVIWEDRTRDRTQLTFAAWLLGGAGAAGLLYSGATFLTGVTTSDPDDTTA